MPITIQQAAINALATWLGTALNVAPLAPVTISKRWPEPEKPLPPKAITILPMGQYSDEALQPRVVSSRAAPSGNAHRLLYRWAMLERTQPLQLDVWANQDITRSQLDEALDRALHAGDAATMGNVWGDPVENYLRLTLPVASGWDGVAVFDFDSSSVIDEPGSVQSREFRAMRQGELRVMLYIEAESYRQAEIQLRMMLDSRADQVSIHE